jgi:hypothetical protein
MTIAAPHPTKPAATKKPAAKKPAAQDKAPLWAFVVGVAILVALADTRAAPFAVAIATAAVVFQVMNL